MNFEITTNPNILFQQDVMASQITLNHHKIGDSVYDIDLKSIELTGNEIYPNKIDRKFRRGDKVFVEIDNKRIEFTLQERIEAVINSGGFLGFKNGSIYKIKDQKIEFFQLMDYKLRPYVKFSKKELIESLGKEINIKEFFCPRDSYLYKTEIINLKRQIIITWDDSRSILSNIIIG